MVRVDNAVIMAAGTSSRFAPLSYERPKALIEVKGEVLIERQICQLKEAGIDDICIVTGYKAEMFEYLRRKFNVQLRENHDYAIRNNTSSIKVVEDIIRNTYICSADNYFNRNVFEQEVDSAYYAAVYSAGPTREWCLETDSNDYITHVTIGGSKTWYMQGQVFWDASFSKHFLELLDHEYNTPGMVDKLWEDVYIEHLDALKLKIRRYPADTIFEFDTLDELRNFDRSYVDNTRSSIIATIACELQVKERDITNIQCVKSCDNRAVGFTFKSHGKQYKYLYANGKIESKGW
ncbi:sugar phosphate nucleotidyltransferase [uncultured Acidaminococcus sp.]|uniref:sugar phosphate nucleotidyltransferase n=1 Tax=uncultured Acidaminococcus sp. TaxID=352152 RepID=UPI0025EAF895|nr:sugar phosphate nucleotidyltransferase [uncultured Acidaminococcus sp.]